MSLTLSRIWSTCGWLAALAALIVLLTACSPAYNWRQVRHEGLNGSMLMPCKPERAQRMVAMLGQGQPEAALSMLSCEAGGSTFAWAVLRIPPDNDSEQVLSAWRLAAWASMKQSVPQGEQSPPGWVKQAESSGQDVRQEWMGPAVDHRQRTIKARLHWWQVDGWIHQAAIYGPADDSDVAATFFESFGLK